jgi:hypothetical protein
MSGASDCTAKEKLNATALHASNCKPEYLKRKQVAVQNVTVPPDIKQIGGGAKRVDKLDEACNRPHKRDLQSTTTSVASLQAGPILCRRTIRDKYVRLSTGTKCMCSQ